MIIFGRPGGNSGEFRASFFLTAPFDLVLILPKQAVKLGPQFLKVSSLKGSLSSRNSEVGTLKSSRLGNNPFFIP